MKHILQISSTTLKLLDSQGKELAQQPCFAHRESAGWRFDSKDSYFYSDVADGRYNTYFPECDRQKIIHQDSWKGAAIDIAYEQLQKIAKSSATQGSPILLVIASSYNDEQIAMLAGIIQELFELTSIIKAPLAYGQDLPSGRYAILEPEIHQLVMTHLTVSNGMASIEKSQIFAEWSLQNIYNHLYTIICEQFVSESRYDPGHATANKAHLLAQLSHASPNSNGVTFKINEHTLHIEANKLIVPLPSVIANAADDRECKLLPQAAMPLREGLLSPVSTLPEFNVQALMSIEALQSKHSEGEGIAVFTALG